MRNQDREKAIALRTKGHSISQIAEILDAPKSSVSNWVKDIVLSPDLLKNLESLYKGRSSIEKRRETRLANESSKRQEIVTRAIDNVPSKIDDKLFVAGVMLYLAEGGKTQRGLVRISNSDPKVIKIMMRFFINICEVPAEKFKGHIHTHSKEQVIKSENYWSEVSGIKKSKFFKTYFSKNKVIKVPEKRILPYGTFDIYVCDTNLFLKIKGWTEGLSNILMNKY